MDERESAQNKATHLWRLTNRCGITIMKPIRTLWGPPGYKAFLCTRLLVCRKMASTLDLPWDPKGKFKQLLTQNDTLVQPWGKVLGPPSGDMHSDLIQISAFFYSIWTPIHVEDIPSGWGQALDPRPVGTRRLMSEIAATLPYYLPPINEREVTHWQPFPNVVCKKSSSKIMKKIGLFEHKPPFPLACLCNKPLSTPSSNILVCLNSLCLRHTNLGLTA